MSDKQFNDICFVLNLLNIAEVSKTILFYVSKKFVQNFTIFKVSLKYETKVGVVRLNRNITTMQGDTILKN